MPTIWGAPARVSTAMETRSFYWLRAFSELERIWSVYRAKEQVLFFSRSNEDLELLLSVFAQLTLITATINRYMMH